MKTAILKALPYVISVGGALFAFWQDNIIMKQDVQALKTEVSRLGSEVLRLRDTQDHQGSAILDRLDSLVDSTNRPGKRR